jgi:hypothetical protein
LNYAPIALFVYNRPQHTLETVQALLKNPECAQSDLYIFSDAAKNLDAQNAVSEVRAYVRQVSGFQTITIIEREENWGLANSIIDGVTQLCRQYGKVIVLEDDLETSPRFLHFMNTMLDLYEHQNNVGSISGYMFPIDMDSNCFFREIPLSWGWATWQRAWSLMETDGRLLLHTLEAKSKASSFNNSGHMPMIKMLKDQINGKNNSWYVRWAASLYLNNSLTLMPNQSLVRNVGIDGSGTHCAYWRFNPYEVSLKDEQLKLFPPLTVAKDSKIERKLMCYFKKVHIIRYINFIYRIFGFGRHKIKMN